MSSLKDVLKKIKNTQMLIVGIVLLLFFAVFLLWFNDSNSVQAEAPLIAQLYFDGEYRIGDGEWQKIVYGEHIPATKGDVTLRGNLHMLTPDGEYVGIYRGDELVALYVNHINLTIYESNTEPFIIDMENPLYKDSVCGVNWTAHTFMSDPEENIEILIHNPHSFGNEMAIDELLSSISFWTGIEFEKGILDVGVAERYIGIFFIMIAIMFLGIALFSSMIYMKESKKIWLLGGPILFAGIYFTYNAEGVALWSDSIVFNTTIIGVAMMFYMFFVAMISVSLISRMRLIGLITVILLGISDAVFFLLPIVSEMLFYDIWIWWVVVQIIANCVLVVCLVKEFLVSNITKKWICIGVFLPLIAFVVDVFGIGYGLWNDGIISQYVFICLFAIVIIMALKFIPHNINAAAKAKELEMEKILLNAELAETRVSTMMSQIRPHFIYNTLGSIEQLCMLDPPKAGSLVHNFAKYLRGNFGELDNPKPIMMSREMEHVHHYISIENVRFPDMTFTFEMNSEDFPIPALTIQPIVENAIKHGLMKLPQGGIIQVVSYETETDYCISVVDDGVGFDTNAPTDDRKHLGIRNIRERLKVMVNGKLEIESTVGVGTKVLITIPKEVC